MSKKDLQTTNKYSKTNASKNKLKKFFFTNAFGILCSRIFGFIRDAMQAALLGTSIYSDIFFIAFKFPNMFRRVVSEGAFVQSFLPFFLSSKNKGAFSVSIFWIFIFFLLILSGLVMWFAPFITKILALGYNEDRIAQAMPLVQIHFWYLILIFIVTYLSTLLQYKNIFWVNAYNTVLLNLAMIVAMLPYQSHAKYLSNDELLQAVYILSYSVLIGGVAQILIHFYPLYISKMWRLQYIGILQLKKWFGIYRNFKQDSKILQSCNRHSHSNTFTSLSHNQTINDVADAKSGITDCNNFDSKQCYAKSSSYTQSRLLLISYKQYIRVKHKLLRLLHDIKVFFKAFFPAMIGASSAQIIAIIDSSLVTLLPHSDGGVSVLNFANRVFQLPLALFAIAISSALFPTIAKAIERKDDKTALYNLKQAFWFLLITLSLCTLGGIMLSNEIIWLLFERKNFTRTDTIEVSFAFIGYMFGLLPFGLTRIFSLWLYSKKQQAKAAKISVLSLAIGTLLCAILILSLRHFDITHGIFWEYRYFLIALAGSIGGIVLMIFNIKEFGISNFLAIISHRKYAFLLVVLLLSEFAILKIFKHFFYIA